MNQAIYSVVTGTGSYVPAREITNQDFLNHEFFDTSGKKLHKDNQEIINQFFGGKTHYDNAIQELEQELYKMEQSA